MTEILAKKGVEMALLEKAKSIKQLEDAKRKLEPTVAGVNLQEQIRCGTLEQSSALTESGEALKASAEGLTETERKTIKKETGWSDQIISGIQNLDQYKILERAGLIEMEINGRRCLVKENLDLDFTDEDGISNRQRIARGLSPLDAKTGCPLELHHLGQKLDSPLVELTVEEHRTGESVPGKKNQGLWHDRSIESEVHGQGSTWKQERENYWKARISDRA